MVIQSYFGMIKKRDIDKLDTKIVKTRIYFLSILENRAGYFTNNIVVNAEGLKCFALEGKYQEIFF